MGFITGLALIVCGLLAAANSIVSKRPDAQKVIDKLLPYQGWTGLVVAFWGLWMIISAILNLGMIGNGFFLLWLTLLLSGVLELLLGFILGFSLLEKYIFSKNEQAAAKAKETREKLVPKQIPLGYAGIGFGLWCIIVSIL